MGPKMLLANFNLANMCAPHATLLRTIMHAIMGVTLARVFGGINLVKIRQFAKLKSPQKFPVIQYACYSQKLVYASTGVKEKQVLETSQHNHTIIVLSIAYCQWPAEYTEHCGGEPAQADTRILCH